MFPLRVQPSRPLPRTKEQAVRRRISYKRLITNKAAATSASASRKSIQEESTGIAAPAPGSGVGVLVGVFVGVVGPVVGVSVGVFVKVMVGVIVGVGAKITVKHCENSEVLLPGSVAVAVMTDPAETVTGSVTLKLALQEGSVEGVENPMKTFPSPKSLGGPAWQEGLEKNSIR